MKIDNNLVHDLRQRGLLKQLTHEDETLKILTGSTPITFYIGFDPTADSLHVGNMMGLILAHRFQKAGHRPIILCGGATGLIGDPTGKTELRKILSPQDIQNNIVAQQTQMKKFIDFDTNAVLVNNADWICDKNYVSFLREVGHHFSVNRMLQAECFKSRMEKGLSFLEFNYMILQAYDFYHLHQTHHCTFQLGGDDQWSNIIAGVELIRRKLRKDAFGITFPLLLTSDGKKMGKTESGAVWLDPQKTSPYDFYQFWRNIADAEVITTLRYLTNVPLKEIDEYATLAGQALNEAKTRLALEITKQLHGEEAAMHAKSSAEKLFAGSSGDDSAMPSTDFSRQQLSEGILLVDALMQIGITKSKGEGRRQIAQLGIAVNDQKIDDINFVLTDTLLVEGSHIMIKKGKKSFHKLIVRA